MRKIIIFSLFLLMTKLAFCQNGYLHYEPIYPVSQNIENGTYTANVSYYNDKTFTKATYILNVTVKNDRVVTIHFGNGGSIHTGKNNEGYIYKGGGLIFVMDNNGNVTAAYTTVTISDENSPFLGTGRQFYILIQ